MKKKLIAGAVTVLALSGCATTDYNHRPYGYDHGYDYQHRPAQQQHDHYGVVERVRWVEDKRLGGGAVIGAIVGGLIGSQIGDGSGQAVATVAGAAAGGAVGHNIEKDRRGYRQVVDVRLPGGDIISITQDNDRRFYEGQRVRIVGTGSRVRIVTENEYDYRY